MYGLTFIGIVFVKILKTIFVGETDLLQIITFAKAKCPAAEDIKLLPPFS